ncbi:hypothetical protein PI125_g10255 [Phytophthora idaei]|nr:hypothetical protein PI125_g10255 [Phytophthora idaei]
MADDSIDHPGWLCKPIYHSREYETAHARGGVTPDPDDTAVIPYWCLTRPFEDLSPELGDRPLLMLFTFVRFKRVFLKRATAAVVSSLKYRWKSI